MSVHPPKRKTESSVSAIAALIGIGILDRYMNRITLLSPIGVLAFGKRAKHRLKPFGQLNETTRVKDGSVTVLGQGPFPTGY